MVCTACLLYFLCINKNCRAATWLTDGQYESQPISSGGYNLHVVRLIGQQVAGW